MFEDKNLSSISYISCGSSRVWYVIPVSHKTRFESIVAAKLLDFKYLNEHYEGIRQIIATKNILFDLNLMSSISFQLRVHSLIQPRNQFVILEPRVYHGGFKMGYSIAKATYFAEFSWPDYGIVSSKNKEYERPLMQFTLLVERTLWMDAHKISDATKNEKCCPALCLHLNRTSDGYAKPCSVPLQRLFKKVRKLFHFINNVKQSVQMMGVDYISSSIQNCFGCKWEGHFFLQTCIIC